jgi:CHRD domain
MRLRRRLALPLSLLMATGLLLGVVAPVAAAPTTLSAVLSGLAEVPPADPDGTGTASVTVDPEAGTLCYSVSTANIVTPITAAHIHEGAAGTAPAANIRVHFSTAVADADGVFSGCAVNPGDYNVPAGVTIQQFLTGLVANPTNYYVNVHNSIYPGGAVRGQLTNPRLCGTVVRNATTGVITVGGTVVPASAVSAEVAALLTAAAAANASVCVDATFNAAGGVVTAVNADATFTLCAAVVATGSGATRAFTVGGVAIPAAQLSASEAAALELAVANSVNACVNLVVVDSVVTDVSGHVEACVTVGAVGATSVTLDGVVIPFGAGSTIAAQIRQGATLSVRVEVNGAAVTFSAVTLAGCAPTAAALPNTSVDSATPISVLLTGLGTLQVLGAVALTARRRRATA